MPRKNSNARKRPYPDYRIEFGVPATISISERFGLKPDQLGLVLWAVDCLYVWQIFNLFNVQAFIGGGYAPYA